MSSRPSGLTIHGVDFYSPDKKFHQEVLLDIEALVRVAPFRVSHFRNYALNAQTRFPGLEETIVAGIDFFSTPRKRNEIARYSNLGYGRLLRPHDVIDHDICGGLMIYIYDAVEPIPTQPRHAYGVTDMRHLALDIVRHVHDRPRPSSET